jgi:hypothetical protein
MTQAPNFSALAGVCGQASRAAWSAAYRLNVSGTVAEISRLGASHDGKVSVGGVIREDCHDAGHALAYLVDPISCRARLQAAAVVLNARPPEHGRRSTARRSP